MDSLHAMMAFLKVVEQGGFSKAAKSLRISTSTLSRQIAQLESNLGVQLLSRTTRTVGVTEAGQVYYERCKHIVEEIRATEEAISQMDEVPRGILRVTAPADNRESLSALFNGFLHRYPEVELELLFTNRYVNMVEEGFDVAIRGGQLPDSSLLARRLLPSRPRLVASPAYLQQYGEPQSVQDLSWHQCLTFLTGRNNNRWTFRHGQVVAVKGRLRADDIEVLYHAALDGLGLALLPSLIVDADIQAGRLVQILSEELVPANEGLSAVYLPNRYLSPKVRVFVDWCIEYYAQNEPYIQQGTESLARTKVLTAK